MKSKRIAMRVSPLPVEVIADIKKHFNDGCRAEFMAWAVNTRLDTAGMWDGGEPVFRPAIYAWAGWQAAWNAKNVIL